MSEHQKLREQVDVHDAAYEQGQPVIPDHKYDELADRLKQVELKLGIEPKLRKCGLAGRKVRHTEPFLGLQSTYDPQELEDWAKGIQDRLGLCTFGVAWKYDGVAVRLKFDQTRSGDHDSPFKFVSAATRGDGITGSDVTDYVRHAINWVPDKPISNHEAMISLSSLEQINEIRRIKGKSVFKCPRSAVVSAFNGACDEAVEHIFLASHFFAGQESYDIRFLVSEWCNAEHSNQNQYDGFVVFVKDTETRKLLGETATHPRWAMAYKNDYYALESVITGIIDQRGQKRRIQFEPRSAGLRTYSTAVCPEWINPVVGAKCAISVRGGNPILAAVF